MCGIYGGVAPRLSANAAVLLRHRGPDQSGELRRSAKDGRGVLVGQTRLNIVCREDVPVPLSRDHQERTFDIVFNGEIYNFVELRAELEALGHTFVTPTDTEVVLVAYQAWGKACLHRFNGMFAVAIWDGTELFLARDRLGKKPLYFSHVGTSFSFASELKAFADLEYEEVPICTALEFYFDEHTPFANILSVRPGECLLYRPEANDVVQETWWSFPEPHDLELSDDDAIDAFVDLFVDACRLRKVADVPVTVFLSGGIDSSLIQAVNRLDTTYTIQFEEFRDTIDEESFVRAFAAEQSFDARMVVPTRADFLSAFGDLAKYLEFPVGSLSVFPLYCLAQAARRDGFRVALSGEGADELFSGYFRNELLLDEHSRIAKDLDGPYQTLCERYFGTGLERFCRMATRVGPLGVPMLVDFFRDGWSDERSFAANISRLESTCFLQPLLVMADRLSMGNSLEVRNPFLDHRIVTFSTGLRDDLKYRHGRGKWILRESLSKLLGPGAAALHRDVKHGLPAPVNQWLFNRRAFDRRDWNHLLLGECLKQLVQTRNGAASGPATNV